MSKKHLKYMDDCLDGRENLHKIILRFQISIPLFFHVGSAIFMVTSITELRWMGKDEQSRLILRHS